MGRMGGGDGVVEMEWEDKEAPGYPRVEGKDQLALGLGAGSWRRKVVVASMCLAELGILELCWNATRKAAANGGTVSRSYHLALELGLSGYQ